MLFIQLTHQLTALQQLLAVLNERQFTTPIKHLGNATIGGHTRHVIELLLCTLSGYETGCIDYENRTRNLVLATNLTAAQSRLCLLVQELDQPNKNLQIILHTSSNVVENYITTNYHREIVYNTEHVIHHLALIKVALIEMNLNCVQADFGIASSTLKYQQTK